MMNISAHERRVVRWLMNRVTTQILRLTWLRDNYFEAVIRGDTNSLKAVVTDLAPVRQENGYQVVTFRCNALDSVPPEMDYLRMVWPVMSTRDGLPAVEYAWRVTIGTVEGRRMVDEGRTENPGVAYQECEAAIARHQKRGIR